MGRTTVSITTQVWGERYASFIPRWWESVRILNRKPDEIVLVGSQDDPSGLMSSVPEWVDVPVVKIQTECEFMQEWATVAVHACTSEWIATMPIDDQWSPTALDAIDEAQGDLIIDRTEFLQGGEWPARWDTQNLQDRRFAPAGVAPFRRNLIPIWDKIPHDCHWNDYAFYLLLAKEGVKVEHTNNLRMIHDLGHTHETMSGVLMNPNRRLEADRQLVRIKQELSL
jgi:hypothetical protein